MTSPAITPGGSTLTHALRGALASALLAAIIGLTFFLGPPGNAGRAHAAPSLEVFASMCTELAAVAGSDPRVMTGVIVLDLESGERCSINGDRPYRTASLYKTVVAAELWRQVRAGDISLDDPLTVEPRHHEDDAPELRPEGPYTISVAEAADRMITFSDNGSAFALRELLGVRAVSEATDWLGMPATSLGEVFMTSPRDQAHLYASLYRGEVVDPDASDAILALLGRQVIADMIPEGLPRDVTVAHKTGTLDTYLHDAGIVHAPGGDFVLVVMTENESFEAALAMIRLVAATVYQAAYAEPAPVAPTATATPVPAAAPVTPTVAATAAPVSEAASENSEGSATDLPAIVLSSEEVAPALEALTDPAVLAGIAALALIVVLGPVLLSRRRRRRMTAEGQAVALDVVVAAEGVGSRQTVRYGEPVALAPQDARLRADRSERGLVMRFGSRRDEEDHSASVAPASRSVSEVTEQPVLPSKRLQRLAEHFRSQGELLATMRDQFEEEMEPLHELIVKQSQTMQAMLQNLEERLRPLNEYADGEETNLNALEERIRSGGQDHVARSFSRYLTEQRQRIDETRQQIDEQRMPFLEYGDAQRETVETALARFDDDLDALEENLAEQRRVMVRMLDAMRSETFASVKEFLDSRQEAFAELARTGSTDPVEISQAAQAIRSVLDELAGKSDYARALLEQAESADRALASAAPSPRPLREEETPPASAPAEDGEGHEEEESEASA